MFYYVVNKSVRVAQKVLVNYASRCFLREDSCAWGRTLSSVERRNRCDLKKTNDIRAKPMKPDLTLRKFLLVKIYRMSVLSCR